MNSAGGAERFPAISLVVMVKDGPAFGQSAFAACLTFLCQTLNAPFFTRVREDAKGIRARLNVNGGQAPETERCPARWDRCATFRSHLTGGRRDHRSAQP